jgi:hypothetical protein
MDLDRDACGIRSARIGRTSRCSRRRPAARAAERRRPLGGPRGSTVVSADLEQARIDFAEHVRQAASRGANRCAIAI